MATPTLSDLRYLWYGGGSAEEYAFLLEMYNQGITAIQVLGRTYVGEAGITVSEPDEDGVVVISGQELEDRIRTVVLTADFPTAANDQTPEDITGMFLPTVIGGIYAITAPIRYQGLAAADGRVGFTHSGAGADLYWSSFGLSTGSASHVGSVATRDRLIGDNDQIGNPNDTDTSWARVEGTLFVGANAGNLQMQGSQGTATPTTPTVYRRGTRMTLERIS